MNIKIIQSLVLAWVTVMLVPGCASTPTADEVKTANYGRDMSAQECLALAERAIGNGLKDPGSAQFRHTGACFKGYWDSVPILNMKAAFGWLQVGEVNGKNAYGGYVGFRQYQALIRDGVVIRYCIADKDGFCIPAGK